jgi:phosphoglycolate phosphatase-like HAD superfamily hydrolase
MQNRKLVCLAISPMFDTILISDAEGIHKPEREIFHRALERLNANPARAVFVGDHPEVDVAGAGAAGTVPGLICPTTTPSQLRRSCCASVTRDSAPWRLSMERTAAI